MVSGRVVAMGNIIALLGEDDIAVFILLDIGVGFPSCERIFEMPHVAFDFLILDFEIGNRGFQISGPS